jgi:hypothetical protein
VEGLQRDVILVFGKTGSGKTEWIKQYLSSCTRVLIADADQRGYPAKHFETFDDLAVHAANNLSPQSFFRFSYTPYEDEFPIFLDLGRILSPIHLVLEEADRLPDPSYCPEYQEIIVRGRHTSTSIVAASIYPALMPKMLRSQASRIIVFRQHEPADIDWLRRVMGEDASRLPNLGDHEFFDWTPGLAPTDGENGPPAFTPQKLNLTPEGAAE